MNDPEPRDVSRTGDLHETLREAARSRMLKIGLGVRPGVFAVIGTEQKRGIAAPRERSLENLGRTTHVVSAAITVAIACFSPVRARAFDAPMCAMPHLRGVASDAPFTPSSAFDDAPLFASPPVVASTRLATATTSATLLACLPTPPAYTGASPLPATPADARAPTSSVAARRAYEALAAHRAAGRTSDALVSLASMRALVPELSDRWDLVLGELRASDPEGCAALERATESPHSSVAARARVALARCRLATRERGAERELRALLARYPELPEALELRLLEAEVREERGEVRAAIAIYRDVDLEHGDAPEAARARAALARLEAAGHRIPAYTPAQLVERADRIVRWGPPDLARTEIAQLLEQRLPARERAEVTLLAARIARVEGRFEDAAALTRQARGESRDAGGDPRELAQQAADLEDAARAREVEEAREDLRRFASSTRALGRAPTARLFAYLRTAARAGLREEIDAALGAIASRSLPCGLRLEAGVIASGSGDDERVAEVLSECVRAPGSIGVAARYHHARALARLGRAGEARVELARVIEEDRSETRWYAMWSRQHLAGLRGAGSSDAAEATTSEPATTTDRVPGLVVESAAAVDGEGKGGERGGAALPFEIPLDPSAARPVPLLPISGSTAAGAPDPEGSLEGSEDGSEDGAEDDLDLDALDATGPARTWEPLPREAIEQRLAELASQHGEAYPWFARALALVRLRDDETATDELHEAYLAWSQSRGRGTLRAGVEAVYRGAAPPRIPTGSAEVWRARRGLGTSERRALGEIAASLGDHGLAIRWGAREHLAMRPRAYEAIVDEVARERGLDPNLLLAVMRVESVYNPRIVSYAGAVGLLQIMPRTGRLIARSMGREAEFGVDDLLDPRTNIELAAWYLSSLIRRFDGCVPLAVASYNGGPHNVRRWLRDHADGIPLDAFLERIPFTQTHRYVRRVLGHWAAYRAQRGLPMVELDTAIPQLDADRVAF